MRSPVAVIRVLLITTAHSASVAGREIVHAADKLEMGFLITPPSVTPLVGRAGARLVMEPVSLAPSLVWRGRWSCLMSPSPSSDGKWLSCEASSWAGIS